MPDLIHFRHSFRGRHLRPHPPHCAHNLIVFGRVIPPTQLSDPNHPADDPFQMPIGIIQHFNASRSPAPPLGRRELISCLAIRVGDAGRDAIRRALHFVRDRMARRIGSHDDASRDESEKMRLFDRRNGAFVRSWFIQKNPYPPHGLPLFQLSYLLNVFGISGVRRSLTYSRNSIPKDGESEIEESRPDSVDGQ